MSAASRTNCETQQPWRFGRFLDQLHASRVKLMVVRVMAMAKSY
jgi:hypothetical protein